MKKLKLLVITLITILSICSFSFASSEPVVTSETPSKNVVSNELNQNASSTSNSVENNIVNSDLYNCSMSFSSNQVIDGNAFICSADVTVNNVINGNAFVIGKNVTIDSGSYIYGDLFVCAENLIIKGNSAISDLYAVCKSFSLDQKAYISRDLKVCAQSANFAGLVGRDAGIFTKDLTVDTTSAKIGNNLSYSSSNTISGLESIVGGNVNYSQFKENTLSKSDIIRLSAIKYIKSITTELLLVVIISLIFIFLTKKLPNKFASALMSHPLSIFLYGFVGMFVIMFASILLAVTIIGIPISICLIVLLIVLFSIARIVTIVGLAKLISNNNKKGNGYTVAFVALLSAVLWILGNIPFVGGLVSFIVNMYGLGLIFYLIVNCFKSKNSNKLNNVNTESKANLKEVNLVETTSSEDSSSDTNTEKDTSSNIHSENDKSSDAKIDENKSSDTSSKEDK